MAATNRNLRDLIAQGQFREDLFYRINVIHLVVPPLRERREDIPLLIDYFLRRFTSPMDANGNGNGNGNESCTARCAPSRRRRSRRSASTPGPATCARSRTSSSGWSSPAGARSIQVEDLPPEIRTPGRSACGRARERRRTVADDLFKKLVDERESFWSAVYPLYMNREITRSNVRDLVHKGLEEARGNYKIVLRLFNMESSDYKRFLNFLRKHDCQLPFKEYR